MSFVFLYLKLFRFYILLYLSLHYENSVNICLFTLRLVIAVKHHFWPISAAVHSSGQTLKKRRRTDFSSLVDLVFSIHAVLFSPGQHSVLYTTECV